MKKKDLVLSIVLVMILISSIGAFAEEYKKGGEAFNNGYNLGYQDGLKAALDNTQDNIDIPYYLKMPGKFKVLDDYPYYKDTSSEEEFLDGYEEGYKDGYQGKTKESNKDDQKDNYTTSLGASLGEIYGFRDYYNKSNSNWGKAIPSNNEIIGIFNLEKQSNGYKSAFISSFKESFKKSYEEGYEKANLEPKKISMETGITDGEYIGQIMGASLGVRDYFQGKSNDYLKSIPRDVNIINDYSLRKDYKEYSDGFLIGFKKAFEENYKESYREANINIHIRDEEDAYNHGKEAGLAKGKIVGNKDFIQKKENNWRNHKFLSSSIIAEYNLLNQSTKYREGFVSGYWEGFSEGYSNTYQNLNQEEVGKKSVLTNIPISGGNVLSSDGRMEINIEKGIYYKDLVVSIEKLFHNPYTIDSRYLEASDVYSIQIGSSTKSFDNSKFIDISIEFHGKSNGGIYKRVNNQWVYLNSEINDDKITTRIRPETLEDKDNIFCVLIDNEVPLLKDIRSHWAKDEINALVRRNIIYGYSDNTFKPERQISRTEFLTLLSRTYNWDLPKDITNIKKFKDYEKFGPRDGIISYGISNGYIKGYEDNTFKPNNPISYREVEIIMGRILKDPNFKWYNTSAKMLYEKQTKSGSYESMNNKITRAEVSYMLYILNQWRY